MNMERVALHLLIYVVQSAVMIPSSKGLFIFYIDCYGGRHEIETTAASEACLSYESERLESIACAINSDETWRRGKKKGTGITTWKVAVLHASWCLTVG